MAGLRIERRLEPGQGAAVLTLTGDITVERVAELERQVESSLEAGARHLVFDLAGLEFIDSASVGVLLHLQQRRAKAGARVVLCNLRPAFRRMVEASGLTEALSIAPDVASALRDLRPLPG